MEGKTNLSAGDIVALKNLKLSVFKALQLHYYVSDKQFLNSSFDVFSLAWVTDLISWA